jgi:hypothetical protein
VDSAFVIFNITGAYAAAQQQFKNNDTGPTLASANCTFVTKRNRGKPCK